MKNEPVSRRTRSKAPIKITSERDIRAQLRAEAAGRIDRSSNDTGGPAKRRKQGGKSSCKLKKAKGGKVSNRSSVANLQNIPDDLLTKIVDFVAASDGHYLYSDRKLTQDDIDWGWHRPSDNDMEEAVELANIQFSLKKISALPPVPVVSLGGVAFLFRSLSTTSKRFNHFCLYFLRNSLFDVDLFGVSARSRLGCLLWMIRKKPHLSRIRSKNEDSSHLLALLLIHCDTSELRACDVKFSGDSLIRQAWLEEFRDEIVDIANDDEDESLLYSGKSKNELLGDLGIERTEYIHTDLGEDEFFRIVAAECPFVEILSITMEFDPIESRLDSSYAAIMSSALLKYVDVNVRLAQGARTNDRRDYESPHHYYSGLTKAISLAPNLRGFRLGSNPNINDKYGLVINSQSLELIDVCSAAKNTFVLSCRCPRLRHFLFYYRNNSSGLLPRGFDTTGENWWYPNWGDRRRLQASHGFVGLHVPSDCSVHFDARPLKQN
mmetsp:Transcript_5423/g.15338  ORF Transcript_5423/g.15338 Transcript_5423/m.15338 type:complete len:492 (-) Transcript_5423:122-1597(-)